MVGAETGAAGGADEAAVVVEGMRTVVVTAGVAAGVGGHLAPGEGADFSMRGFLACWSAAPLAPLLPLPPLPPPALRRLVAWEGAVPKSASIAGKWR